MLGTLFTPRRWRPEIALRVFADALMVTFAFLTALFIEFEWFMLFTEVGLTSEQVGAYLASMAVGLPLLLTMGLGLFAWFGFYTRSRAYRSRYKALVVAQAVTITYLLFALSSYLFPQLLPVPRFALLLGWALTLGLLIGARLWSQIWARTSLRDMRPPAATEAGTPPRILVIGGAGYIGSALLPLLLERGYNVRLLDLLLFGTEPIRDVLDHPQLEIVRADFRNVDQAVGAMQGVDAVIHLGAIVGDPACAIDEELTLEINLMATRMLAEVAKGSGVRRFVFASTCSVYGASDETLTERSALNPVSLYARSKIASERVLLQLAGESFAPVILRFGTVYGLSGRTRFDLVVNLLTAKAVTEGKITVFGGDQWRPFVHVADAALAVFKALEAPLPVVRGEIFNVGSNAQNYTITQVGELVHRLVPTAELIASGGSADRRNYRVNFDKIERMLGYRPRWTVEAGVQQVLEAFARGEIADYRDARYCNTKSIGQVVQVRSIEATNGWARALIERSYEPVEGAPSRAAALATPELAAS